MSYIERAVSAAHRNFLEGLCKAVSSTTDVWGPECDMETVYLPENAWLQAVIGILAFKLFVHYCWLLEIACIPGDDERVAMAKWWLFSAAVSAGLTVFNPAPNTSAGFFFELENLYVPLVVKSVQCNAALLL
jgi:hypothetical protein